MDWRADLFVTESAVLLRPRLVLAIFFGIPLLLPCYRIPLSDVAQATVEANQPSRLYRILGKSASHTLLISTEVGAVCLVDFASTADLHTTQRLIGR